MGLAAYYAGAAVVDAVERYGAYAIAAVAVLVVAAWLVLRRLESRV
jgi:uncharacterized protein (TIGR03382 family)